ncbi:MAG: hypothetical protein C3F13_02845 [Anaerolineales bacterium]|nr:MAG: hypothetical protein C3F13_02845 [Anaerolineales bacterium]
MQFPETERVVYHKNPLIEVICQLRFPPILSIESELPTKFQEAIRGDYPLFNQNVEIQVKVTDDPTMKLPDIVNLPPTTIKNKNYEFLSSDEKWKVNLTNSFLSLSTIDYSRWEEFFAHLRIAYQPFIDIYRPPFFTRIGLRYRDMIRRSFLGLQESPWTELLQPYMLGLLTAPGLREAIHNTNHISEIELDDESIVRISSGIFHDQSNKEDNFIIDSDFFSLNKVEVDKSMEKLNFFNSQASRLIQWCITPKLHAAMEPEKI